jgi:outer membrane protein TolC
MTTLLNVRAARALGVWLLLTSGLTANLPRARAQQTWTLDRVEQVALDHSPRVQRARADVATAEAYRAFGRMPAVRNPLVTMRAMIGRPDDPAATYAVVVGLPFEVSGKRKAWRREAGFVVNQAEAQLGTIRNEVRADARQAYVEVAMAEAARNVANDSAATAHELVTRVQARLAAKAATALDVSLAESQLSEVRADAARSERELVEALGALRQALGLPATETVVITPLAAPTFPANLTIEDAIARALRERREALAFASERDRFRAADRRLRREAVGPLTAGFEAEQQGNQRPNRSVGANVSFELPFVMTNQGERAVASKQASSAELSRALAEETIARETATSYQRLVGALKELSELESHALPAAERTLAMVQTMLDAGAIDYFRLLTARSSAFALRSRRVQALRQAWLSRIALERALGGWKETP